MKKYGFGVDIGGTTCKIGLFETTGALVEKWEIPTRKENNGENILPDVAAAIAKKMVDREIPKGEIQGIGIGVPGPVTSEGVVLRCVNLGWDVINVAKDMTERTGFNVKVGNDANVAALGEMWQGGAKGRTNVVLVTLGTGVGGGVIIDGKIVITVEYDEGLSRVSIDAPKDMEIMRGEVWEQEFPRPACLNKPRPKKKKPH